jgi:hypothetical protein
MRVDHGRTDVLVPQEFLHRPNDVAGGRETVRLMLERASRNGSLSLNALLPMPWASYPGISARRSVPLLQLDRDKARCVTAHFLIPAVENRTCGFYRIRLSTCGPSPWPTAMKRPFAFLQPTPGSRWTTCAFAGYLCSGTSSVVAQLWSCRL